MLGSKAKSYFRFGIFTVVAVVLVLFTLTPFFSILSQTFYTSDNPYNAATVSFAVHFSDPPASINNTSQIKAVATLAADKAYLSISGPKQVSIPMVKASSTIFTWQWNTSDYPAGIYYLSVIAARYVDTTLNSTGIEKAASETIKVEVAPYTATGTADSAATPGISTTAPEAGSDLKIELVDPPASATGEITLKALASMDVDLATYYITGTTQGGTKSFAAAKDGTYYAYKWNTASYADGQYSVEVRAIKGDLPSVSSKKTITVANNSPAENSDQPVSEESTLPQETMNVIFLDKPGTVSGKTFINVNVDPEPEQVSFLIDGPGVSSEVKALKVSARLFTLEWDTTSGFPNSLYTVSANAVGGNNRASADIFVKVLNESAPAGQSTDPTAGDSAPSSTQDDGLGVIISEPDSHATVKGSVRILASTKGAVAKVEFFRIVNNYSVRISGNPSPQKTAEGFGWLLGWDTARLVNGIYYLKAKAYDAKGNAAQSKVIYVYVKNPEEIFR